MAPISRKNTINHFIHPGHMLTEIKCDEEYKCDGCKLNGVGTRFNCSQCEFDLHEHCAMCPMTLTSHMHPSHILRLIIHEVSLGTHYCHACHKSIEGLVYQCTSKDCSFIVHPGCANSSSSFSDTPPSHEQLQGAPAATETGTRQAGGALGNNMAQQVAVGIATHTIYDRIQSNSEEIESNYNGIKSFFKSIFESSSDY